MEAKLRNLQSKFKSEVSIMKMIESRFAEIDQLNKEFKPKAPKLFLQRLPIFMRRRVASHNPKRLPKRMRYLSCNKISADKQKKRKQRKKYLNPNKVALSLARRDKKGNRSFLHLWFVKRFKMITEHDLLIPDFNTTKNRRMLHRMSKSGSIYFYLPYLKCILLKFSNENYNSLIYELSRMSTGKLKKFLENFSEETSFGTFVFYEIDAYPFHVLGPVDIVLRYSQKELLAWCHNSFFEKLLNHFKTLLEEKFEIHNVSEKLDRFKLVGESSLQALAKVFAQKTKDFPSILLPNVSITFNNDISFTLPNLSTKHLFSEDFPIIIFRKNYLKRFVIDVIVPRYSSKAFWYTLVRNRSHLVGGLRDIKTLACDISCLYFPYTGYPDKKVSISHENSIVKLTNYLKISNEFFVLRDNLDKIKDINQEDYKIKIQLQPELKYALLIVELICLTKGNPFEGDLICFPEEKDITTYVGKSRLDIKLEDITYGPSEIKRLKQCKTFDDYSRKVIGVVEYGGFSLETGKAKAFGAISLTEYVKLPSFEELRLVLLRSLNSPQYRFAKIILHDFDTL